MSITPKVIQDLLDELEASKQSRLRPWTVLQVRRGFVFYVKPARRRVFVSRMLPRFPTLGKNWKQCGQKFLNNELRTVISIDDRKDHIR